MSNQLDASIAKRLDITVRQNQTFDVSLTFNNEAGDPVSLTDAVAKLSVRQGGCNHSCGCDGDTPFDLVYKQDFNGEILGAGSNIIAFNDLVILSPGTYKYDLLVEYPSNYQRYLLFGTFKVKKSYTTIP